ncbi:MAG: Fe-S oxidoreductase [uncultured Acidimicrobiales bacterium]|uniref:Fe-S oxidoreductase n=1 Tax=uncultured Acidimicrobiales bacterium TaxID=310071 RepID=A0A6J4IKW5_9ACTN|nr:MAG: Fe-S oxidoreductase [uncultured Acidimicrobiales bacterium]
MAGPRLKPSHLALAVGVGFAALTALSGTAAALLRWDAETEVHRPVFSNIPGPVQVIFYVSTFVSCVAVGVMFAQRFRGYERGTPDNRRTTAKNARRRVADFRSGVYMQTVMRDGAAGLMHSLMYFPFLGLFAVTTILEIDHSLPERAKFLHGRTYQAFSAFGDLMGVLFLVGIVWAFIRRYVIKVYRIRIKTRPEDAVILGTLFLMGLTGLVAEAARIALDGQPDHERWSFVGYPLSYAFRNSSYRVTDLAALHQGLWVAHIVAFLGFLLILPTTKMRHMFTSPMNMYLRDRERPRGAMKPVPNMTETSLETFGAGVVEDFTWKQLLDTDACTVCGRCTNACPAHATGKSLDPREIVLKVGEVMCATNPGGPVSPVVGTDREITISSSNVFERVTPEEIWACTSCRACDEVCPVNIEILDKILDMRRYLTLMESSFPTELSKMFNAMENQENPWALSNRTRAEWADGLPVEVPIVDGSQPFGHEYLFWVGCAGSFDDRAKKVTIATAKLLQRAGVDFAILGPSERCSGDPARRSGNEYIFQMLAMQNVETLNAMGVTKIITICPHCFNTLGNDYPQLDGRYEVVHHSQFLEFLIASNRLLLDEATLEERVVYHDACYLGRHNDVYGAPRNVIGSLKGIQIVEAPRNGNTSMCCGAGGARMWMEENIGTKVNTERSRELIATDAKRVATACPFCYIMIDDGVKEHGREDVMVKDIAMHLVDAIEAGERLRTHVGVPPVVTQEGAADAPVGGQ